MYGGRGFGSRNKNMIKKGCIYYTDFSANPEILNACQKQLRKSFDGEIISVSLNKPLNFGKNIVLKANGGVVTMFRQILLGLETSTADIVFFTENDVLYHKSHFDFEPLRDDTFYYNTNIFQLKYPEDFAITYDTIKSLSGLCVNRKLAIEHYKKRLQFIKDNNFKDDSKQPYWARRIGWEPGTKSKRQEMISHDKSECWKSEYSNIDIRHKNTLTPVKMSLDKFKHKPKGWKIIKASQIPGWNLKEIINIKVYE